MKVRIRSARSTIKAHSSVCALVASACLVACSGSVSDADEGVNAAAGPSEGIAPGAVGSPVVGVPNVPGAVSNPTDGSGVSVPGSTPVPPGASELPGAPPVSPGAIPPVTSPVTPIDPSCQVQTAATPPLRRLTNLQYTNSVRDLLQIDVDVSDQVGDDEAIGTFASNVSVPATRVVIESYRGAAEFAATEAVGASPVLDCQDGENNSECAVRVIADLVPRALRRPVDAGIVGRYQGLYDTFGAESHELGMRTVVQALLQSPYFVYHVEEGEQGPTPHPTGTIVQLSNHELASRLSYFLWNSIPDGELRAAADAGQLSDQSVVRAQVSRMLADSKARTTMDDFHTQWLHVGDLDRLEKDTDLFPDFESELGELFKQELTDFANGVIREGDGMLPTLFMSAESTAHARVLEVYGASRPDGIPDDAPVELDAAERAGLLTRAGFLSAHAHVDQTSPVARGVVVREGILCQTLPSPPPDVDSDPPEVSDDATTRERFAQHVEDVACSGCHALIDDIGLGFENYDAIGQFRSEENGIDVDGSGMIVSGGDVSGNFSGAVELSQKFAESQTVRECVASQWFNYGLGRAAREGDTCSLEAVQVAFNNSGGNIPQLLESVATSSSFRLMQVGY